MKRKVLILALIFFAIVFFKPLAAYADDPSPWGEILNPDGTIQWNNLTDLGNTSQPADWMAINLPGGVVIHPDATYHRYLTPSGNILVLPSPATLFFMALNPQASGLSGAQSMLGNGAAVLSLLAGPSLNQDQLAAILQQGYTSPQEFFQAVIDGRANIWTVVNVNFIYDLLYMSYQSDFLVNALLLYLNGSADCAQIPGGCAGLPSSCVGSDCNTLPTVCPAASIQQAQPELTIEKVAPDHPLVVGQDPTKRGADIQVSATIPPVIFTWYEPVQDPPTCEFDSAGEGEGCDGPGSLYADVIDQNGKSINWKPFMENNTSWKVVDGEIHCIKHVETLPEPITSIQASAELNPESRSWILNDLAEKYYEAYIHNPVFNLAPGMAQVSGGCDVNQTCSADALVTNVPFADPGTFDLKLWVITAGASFNWQGVAIPITQPRTLYAQNLVQIYVTLVTLLPAGAP